MEVHIHAHHGHLPAENVENLNARVEKGLAQFDSRLTRVEVFFKDTNGPKGGVDCHCSVEARPPPLCLWRRSMVVVVVTCGSGC